jgi:uroporphyrinogen decarboxylase
MESLLLENLTPDFAELKRVLKGEQEPQRAHPVELHVDPEVLQVIKERYLGEPWVPPWKGRSWFPPREGTGGAYFHQLVTLYDRLGYDFVRAWAMWRNHPAPRTRRTQDTAQLSRGEREWVDERRGLITSWEEFEEFPWDMIRPDCSVSEFMAQGLPPGMKIVVSAMLFEHVMEILLGNEVLFYMLYDEPELVTQVFYRWGQKVYDYYKAVIDMEEVGAIFHADDLGFKTSTLLSPEALRRFVLPWLKRYSALAHARGKMFWYHCCGNVYNGVIEDLIEDVRIDALHSFQDAILRVADFKARYGQRVAALGGVDVDKLARLDEQSLREYIRTILEQCMPGGRFAVGSGNSITNYVPVENYIVLLEETRRWSG